jgi:orotate phosphoribosyltransferase-like protein
MENKEYIVDIKNCIKILKLRGVVLTIKEIAEKYNISPNTITNIGTKSNQTLSFVNQFMKDYKIKNDEIFKIKNT